ncbi:pyridoxal-phosphate dependent enzyme [Francisella halioticida]|uniref:pyridoxal-phosphate dependent enzyme n=1 Tax=Francisella halioticida TaxID=549298 RepID=UPI001BB32BA0|nr:pyridoxal-phosphate dependent enzyme [Francisella halioticida]
MGVYPDNLKAILNINSAKKVADDIKQWPKYDKTKLFNLDNLAQEVGVKKIWYKDESTRFGLGSFKALGGAYAVVKQIINYLEKEEAVEVSMKDLLSGKYKDKIKNISVSCATDGNHGRSVAWGAQLFDCKCVIYLHANVSKSREESIASYGAEVIRITGNYDDYIVGNFLGQYLVRK